MSGSPTSRARARPATGATYIVSGVVALNVDIHAPTTGGDSLFTFALHELAHAVGLGHTTDATQIMAPTIPAAATDYGSEDSPGWRRSAAPAHPGRGRSPRTYSGTMRRSAPFVCGVALLAVSACSGSSTSAAPAPASNGAQPARSPLPTCAAAATKPYTWPTQVPQELPRLPAATVDSTKQTTDGLTLVQFSTATSLRDGVIFIVRQLPAAGFTLGRGDAEQTEADAPFTKGGLRGVLRGSAVGVCSTKWILAVTRQTFGGGSPLLPAHVGPSPSPLPFG